MSMLADRKRKQKWCLNPRGNLWRDDENKFGKRLMEKMGWSDGKGLGAKEDGATEHVKVSYKNDSRGMGFKENGEQWTEHEDKFTSLLKSLDPNKGAVAETDEPEISGKSLEEKSKSARGRVHYQKFTRGKDLSRYSEKDLANILGKKSLKDPKQQKTADKQSNGEGTENDENRKFGVETVERGSMVDYFKQKFPHFSMKSRYEIGENGVLKSTKAGSDSESDVKCGFGFSQAETPAGRSDLEKPGKMSFVSYVTAEEPEESKEEKNKKKKKRKNVDETDDMDKNDSKRTKIDENGSFVNPAFDPMARTKIVGVRHSLTTINEEKMDENEEMNEAAAGGRRRIEEENAVDMSEIHKKTAKRRKSENKKPTLEPLSENVPEEGPETYSNCVFDDSPKRNEADDVRNVTAIPNPYEVVRKSKKSKKERASIGSQEDLSFCNAAMLQDNRTDSNLTTQDDNDVPCNVYEVKRKKKKKEQPQDVVEKMLKKLLKMNRLHGVDNPSLNTGCVAEEISAAPIDDSPEQQQQISKRQKKESKKSSQSALEGLENPALNVTVEEGNNSLPESRPLNSVQEHHETNSKEPTESTSKRKKKKQKPSAHAKESNAGLSNPALDVSQEIESNKNSPASPDKDTKCQKHTINGSDNLTNSEEATSKRKKKMKTSPQAEQSSLDIPALDVSQETETDKISSVHPAEKKTKNTKCQKDIINNGLDNPSLDLDCSQEINEYYQESLTYELKNLPKKVRKRSREIACLDQTGKEAPKAKEAKKKKKAIKSSDSKKEAPEAKEAKKKKKAIKSSDSKKEAPEAKEAKKKKKAIKSSDSKKEAPEAKEAKKKKKAIKSSDSKKEAPKAKEAKKKKKAIKSSDSKKEAPEAKEAKKKKKAIKSSDSTVEEAVGKSAKKKKAAASGVVNKGFDLVNNVFTEGVQNLNEAVNEFQNKLENDMNEEKQRLAQARLLRQQQKEARWQPTRQEHCENQSKRTVPIQRERWEPFQRTVPAQRERREPFQRTVPAQRERREPFQRTAPAQRERWEPFQRTVPAQRERWEPFQRTAPAQRERWEPFQRTVPAQRERWEPFQRTAPAQRERWEPFQRTVPAQRERWEPFQRTAPAQRERWEPFQRTAPAQRERWEQVKRTVPVQRENQSKFRQERNIHHTRKQNRNSTSTDPLKVEPPTAEEAKFGCVLKYDDTKMRKNCPKWRSDNTSAKKAYKHLITTDILIQFNGTNLHHVEGYATSITMHRDKSTESGVVQKRTSFS